MTGLPRFTHSELQFSAKCFAAAALALYVASSAGLPRPFWALMTTYIVAHPLASNVRSKALFRLIGTLLGCAATIILIPPLSGAPELLSLALALWTGVCLYMSLLDRSARSYVFMLAGYSAALIGFPLVEAPGSMFNTAIARVEEIGLGILCASLVHGIVLPVGLAPSLLGVMDRALGDARRWIDDLLAKAKGGAKGPGEERVAADRLRLALDITQLRLLSTHVPFDTIEMRWTAGAIATMQDRISTLTPTLMAAEDRLCALEDADGALADDICSALAQFSRGLDADASEDALDAVRLALQAIAQGPCAEPWIRALRTDLAVRLGELHTQWRACAALRHEIAAGLTTGTSRLRRTSALGQRVLHRDRGMALRSAATAVLATCVACAIWISIAWPGGSAAAMSAAVFCSFFATMDDPVPAMQKFVTALLWSMPVSIFYVLVAIPWTRNFEMLMFSVAPFLLLVGCYLARPANALAALGMFFGVVGTLALHDTANSDLVTFVQSNLALLMGAVVAARTTALVRSVSAEWSARRLRRATLLDLARLVSHSSSASVRDAFIGRMLDRISLLMPRAALIDGQAGETAARQALRELSLGADVAALQQQLEGLSSKHVAQMFGTLDRVLRAELAGTSIDRAPLLSQIDGLLLDAVRASRSLPGTSALVGLRRNLFPTAPPALQP